MRVIKLFLGLTLLLCTGNLAAADPFTALWIFGDSTVDTGWYRTNQSGEDSYDYYMQQSSLGVGKPTSSPGLVSVEVLANLLNLSAIPQNQTNGTNYATGGAKNNRQNASSGDGFPKAVPTVTQIENYLANNTATDTALYVISSGDNDVAFALNHSGPKRYLANAANLLALEIKKLKQNGNHAKFILIAGLPKSFGSTAQKKSLRQFYNRQLRKRLAALHVAYLWGNIDAVRALLESYNGQPSSPFGISNYGQGSQTCGTCAACPLPILPPHGQTLPPAITTDWAYVCSTTTGAPSIATNAAASEWADNNHYATGGQQVFGVYFYCAAKAKWPTLNWGSPTLPFDCQEFSSVLP